MTEAAVRLDYSNPSVVADPFAVYEAMHAKASVVRSEELGGLAVVTGYDDVMQVLRDTATFSNRVIGRGSSRESVRRVLAEGFEDPPVLQTADGPLHDYHAGLVKPYLQPGRLRGLTDPIREIAQSMCDAIEPGEIDFVNQFARGLSIHVLAMVIGSPVDQDALDLIYSGTEANSVLIGAGGDALTEEFELESARHYVTFQHYVAQLIRDRQQRPADDLISEFVHAPVPPGFEPLTFPEMVALVVLMIGAGNETTRSWMGSAMMRIASDPELQQRVRNEPDHLQAVLEETLRCDSPVMLLYRVATCDTEVGGVPINEGERVGIAYGAANHDGSRFDCPHRFDSERGNARTHVAFGYGSHYCIGATLARIEAELGVQTFLDRFGTIELSRTDSPAYFPAPITRTLSKLPLRVEH
jgi:cytochrome P450